MFSSFRFASPSLQMQQSGMRSYGFTLLELLIVMAMAAILSMLAVPAFFRLIADVSLSGYGNVFVSDARFARSEAQKRGMNVVMCRTTTPDAASPSCAVSGSTSDWKTGWLVFADANGNETYSAADNDVLLRVQEALPRASVFGPFGSDDSLDARNYIRFTRDGRAANQEDTFKVKGLGSLADDEQLTRVICVNSTGRMRILPKGTFTCS